MISLYDEQEKLFTLLLFFLDLFLVALSMRLTYLLVLWLNPGHVLAGTTDSKYLLLVPSAFLLYFSSFIFFGFYRTFRHQSLDQVFSKTFVGVIFGIMVLITFFFFLGAPEFNRGVLGVFALVNFIILSASRSLAFVILQHYRRKGYNHKKVLIVGSKTRAQEMIDAVIRNPGAGYRVIGCLELDDSYVGATVAHNIQVVGTLARNYRSIILNHEVDELVFAIPLNEVKNGPEYVTLAEEAGVSIRVLPDWQIQKMTYHPGTASIYFDQFLGLPTLALSSIPQKETELLLKSVMDYLGALTILILASPVLLLTALAIKLTSRGPLFFTQIRCGLNGRRFTVFKFRSMVRDADSMKADLEDFNEQDGPAFKMKNDPRFTPIGKFIRMTSIDELPQLINILRGEMSLVGPRPPIPKEVERYKPWQRRRLSLKPGLTCIWQVKARNNTDFDTWMKYDLEYIDNWSIVLDIKLLLQTIPAILFATGR